MRRLESRADMSNRAAFAARSGASHKDQQSVGFGLLYSFTGKVQ